MNQIGVINKCNWTFIICSTFLGLFLKSKPWISPFLSIPELSYEQWKYFTDPQVMYQYRFTAYLSCGNMRSCSELYNSCSTFERNWPHHLSPPQSWTSRRPVCNRILGVPLIHRCLNNSSQAWAWKVLCRTTGTECPFKRREHLCLKRQWLEKTQKIFEKLTTSKF